MKTSLALLALSGWVTLAQAQTTNTFPLWPDGAPGALGKEVKDIPTLTPFLPNAATTPTAAIVICPGGGYCALTATEGVPFAKWLNQHGIVAFVLKYRLGSDGYRYPAMLHDAARAVRTVRARAPEWNVDPHRVGIIGASAGGHLASALVTHFDPGDPNAADPIERQSSRPDLGILCYAVISATAECTHWGSIHNLLGQHPSPEILKEVSNELHVTKNTPPCFIWHTAEDPIVPVENSLLFAQALLKSAVPFDLHIYQSGGHGLGLGRDQFDSNQMHPWTRDCIYWLKQRGFAD